MNLTFDVKNIGLEMTSGNLLTFDVMSNVKFSADIRREFGRWIQKQREDRGLSQKFIAEKVGITDTQLSRIENGKSGTERDTVILLAKEIGIDENEALRKFKPENAASDDTHEVAGVANITFTYKAFTRAEQQQLLDIMRIAAQGVLAEKLREE